MVHATATPAGAASPDADSWKPGPEHLAQSNVSALARALGLSSYDELYRFSVEHPAEYWRAVTEFCGIVWSQPYRDFADYSRGREFARWFVGGRLNWTDTVFRWALDPASAARTAVIAETEGGAVSRVSYAELFEEVRRFAAGLAALGIARGDRVGLLMEPGIPAVTSMLALSYAGIVVIPLFTGFGVEPVVSRLASCRARALISTTGFYRRGRRVDAASVAREASRRAELDLLILKYGPGEARLDGAVAWDAVFTPPPSDLRASAMASDEPLMVFYTSGTTGKPKGTLHVHGSFPLKIIHDAVVHFDIKAGDVFFWPADMGWVAGAQMIASTLMQGATLVCYDGAPDVPDWSRLSRIIEGHRVTHFATSPTTIRGLAANAAAATAGDRSSLRLMITAGEVIDPDHFVWHARHFGGGRVPLVNHSGGTEVSSGLVSNVVVKPIPAAGFNTACPGVAVDVVDGEGQPVLDTVGELVIREPFVGMTQSFWEDDARYLETYWRTLPGLWVHGDLAIRKASGEFVLRGRSDDTIKLAGKRVGPAEIEEVLLELPGVGECAAIGVDDPVKGQMLVVFVVPRAAAKLPDDFPAEIARHVEARFGRAFRPGRVHVVAELPKTRTAKVMRRVIRGIYAGSPPGDLSSLDNPSALDEIARVAEPGAGHRAPIGAA